MWFSYSASVVCLQWMSLDITVLTHGEHTALAVVDNGCDLLLGAH